MGYKDILVYLDPTPASQIRLDIAMEAAVVDGAYVTAVDASTDESFAGDWREAATGIEMAFHAALQANLVAGEFHVAGPHGKLEPEDLVVPADLVIAPSPSPETRRFIHADLPDAANSMRDFLVTAFVGMILAHQASLDPSKGHAAPKHGHSHHRHR